MIKVEHLTKSYGPHQAIKDLCFTVKKGEVVGFLGPNGAGKTTAMKIITGYMAPTSGLVEVAGFDVFENPIEVKKRIGYLPETPPVYGDMYVTDYLRFVARLKGVAKANIDKNVQDSIEKANLGEVRRRLIQNLSKGFRQRVGIAQALVSDPSILILDEPTVGLDPKQVAEIRDLINSLRGQHTIILSTHILPEVQATCEKVIIINHGEIVAEDTLTGLSRRMSGSRRVVLKVRRTSDSLQQMLGDQKGVVHVDKPGANGTFHIDLEEGEENLENLASYIVDQGLGLMEIRSMDASLEDIFIKLTSSEDKVQSEIQSKNQTKIQQQGALQ